MFVYACTRVRERKHSLPQRSKQYRIPRNICQPKILHIDWDQLWYIFVTESLQFTLLLNQFFVRAYICYISQYDMSIWDFFSNIIKCAQRFWWIDHSKNQFTLELNRKKHTNHIAYIFERTKTKSECKGIIHIMICW